MLKIRVCKPGHPFLWVLYFVGQIRGSFFSYPWVTLSLWRSPITQSHDQAPSTLQVLKAKEIPRSFQVGGVWRREAEKQKQDKLNVRGFLDNALKLALTHEKNFGHTQSNE